jgi:hypothetical protein
VVPPAKINHKKAHSCVLVVRLQELVEVLGERRVNDQELVDVEEEEPLVLVRVLLPAAVIDVPLEGGKERRL